MNLQRIAVVCAIGLALAMTCSAQAEYIWDNGSGDNDWHNPVNWNPDGDWLGGPSNPAPPENDYVIGSGTAIGSFNTSSNGGGSILINGGDVEWNGRFHAIGNSSGSGFTGVGTLTITSGSFTRNRPETDSNRFTIGNSFNADGKWYQEGGAVTFNDKLLEITWYGNSRGLYEISGGSLALNAGILLGAAPSGSAKFRYIGDNATVTAASYSGANSRTTTYFELDGLGRTIIDVAGAVSLSGSHIDIDVAAGASITPGTTFTLFEAGGSLSASSLDLVYDPLVWAVAVNEGAGGTIEATYIPEPSMFVLLAIGAGLVLALRRRG